MVMVKKMLKVKLAIFHILFRKEEEVMATVYATLIVKGKKTFAQVPDTLKAQVREILIALECEDLITE